jgi:hypothetical protein
MNGSGFPTLKKFHTQTVEIPSAASASCPNPNPVAHRHLARRIPCRHHGLTIDDETLLPYLARSFEDARKPFGPIVSATGDQAHAVALALQSQPIAVVFHFVKPIWAEWNPLCGPVQVRVFVKELTTSPAPVFDGG